MADCFPRTADLPSQSALFWVTHKERYLRQLLIRDIEAATGRALIVYFGDCNDTASQIDSNDDVYIAELLNDCAGKPIDLLLETNGGGTDATEKICSLLRRGAPDLRVVVPRRAKSNGTVIALTGQKIVMGLESELGPIDPSINGIPVAFVLNAPPGAVGVLDVQMAETARKQTEKLASHLLASGMLAGKSKEEIKIVIDKIATRDHYHSHGSVIDAKEAADLGFAVEELGADSALWRQFTLLRAMYAHDCAQNHYSKIFEGNKVSLVVMAKQPAAPGP